MGLSKHSLRVRSSEVGRYLQCASTTNGDRTRSGYFVFTIRRKRRSFDKSTCASSGATRPASSTCKRRRIRHASRLGEAVAQGREVGRFHQVAHRDVAEIGLGPRLGPNTLAVDLEHDARRSGARHAPPPDRGGEAVRFERHRGEQEPHERGAGHRGHRGAVGRDR